MTMPGLLELGIIFLIILLLFGAKRLPGIGRSFGEAIREFIKSIKSSPDSGDDSKNKDSEL